VRVGQAERVLTLAIVSLQRCREKFRDDANVDMTVDLQAYPSVTGLCAQLDRIPRLHAPAPHPRSESPEGVRRLEQRYKRGSVRADRHNSIKHSTAKDWERKRQSFSLEVASSIKRDRHDQGFGSIIHATYY
jgi:hypothetical protein